VCILGFRFFDLINAFAVNVFFFDQWDFLAPFFEGDATFTRLFLAEPTPFREGLGLIVDKYLYAATDWNVRAEGFLIAACVFIAMLLALVLKRRLFGKLSLGDAIIPMIFLTLGQYETFIGTPNPSYSGIPLILILLYCLSQLQRRYPLRFALCLVLNFFLVYTGYGLLMGPITLCIFAMECYWSLRRISEVPLASSITALAIAAATLGSFFIHYRFFGGVSCFVFPYPHLSAYPRFVALMVAQFVNITAPSTLALAVGAVGLLIATAILAVSVRSLVKGRRLEPLQIVSGVLIAYSLLFAANAAVGRVCIGPAAASASRYVTQMIPGALGIYLFVQSLSRSQVRQFSLVVLTALLIRGCLFVSPGMLWYTNGKRAWVNCYVLTEDIAHCDQATNFQIHPRPEETKLKQKLDYLKEHHLNLFADD
jgi:hypothetical protein